MPTLLQASPIWRKISMFLRNFSVPVLHADFLILGDGALDVGGELLERDVRGERNEADLVEHGLDLGGLQAVQAGELHAVVAHFLELLHRALEIALGVVADGINLHRYG